MTDDSAILSVDFLVGFTIFLIAFIWVATLVPSLFLGVSSTSIDYDAVAYRTGVILAEDPGATSNATTVPWELTTDKRDVLRFGLAVSKDTPNILDENKINQFFCSTAFIYPDDYRTRAIFGDYPYSFNISLRTAGENQVWMVGDIIPNNYGYIRRDVKIKGPSNATIDQAMINTRGYYNTANVSLNVFSIQLNSSLLAGPLTNQIIDPTKDPAYQINLQSDEIIINITGLDQSPPRITPLGLNPTDTNLTAINFYQVPYGYSGISPWYPSPDYSLYTDGNLTPAIPANVTGNISMIFGPGFFQTLPDDSVAYVNLTFGTNPGYSPHQYLNNTLTGPFPYDYSTADVTQPALKDAVMEVAVW